MSDNDRLNELIESVKKLDKTYGRPGGFLTATAKIRAKRLMKMEGQPGTKNEPKFIPGEHPSTLKPFEQNIRNVYDKAVKRNLLFSLLQHGFSKLHTPLSPYEFTTSSKLYKKDQEEINRMQKEQTKKGTEAIVKNWKETWAKIIKEKRQGDK